MMDQLLLLFLYNFRSLFSYARGDLETKLFTVIDIFGYAANYNTEGAFLIIFLICSDPLNCLRRVDTIVNNNKKWLKQPQSHFH